jgi:hypothetical protein
MFITVKIKVPAASLIDHVMPRFVTVNTDHIVAIAHGSMTLSTPIKTMHLERFEDQPFNELELWDGEQDRIAEAFCESNVGYCGAGSIRSYGFVRVYHTNDAC